MLKQDFLAKYATVEATCEWLEGQTGSKWSLARLLESGLKPWFMLAREPNHNEPIHDELFGKGQATYPAQILSERDIQNLAIDGREAIVHKITAHDGREVDVGPVGLWRVPLHEIRFRSEDIQTLAGRHALSASSPGEGRHSSAVSKRVWPNGGNALTPTIWEICYDLRDAGERVTAGSVMRELQIRAQSTDPKIKGPLVSSTAGGVKWETSVKGIEKELFSGALDARIKEWRKAQK